MGCFHDCSLLSSIIFPNSATVIPNYCFLRCSSLSSIIIPNSVTYIGDSNLKDCFSLQNVGLSLEVKFGSQVFWNCPFWENIHPGEEMERIEFGENF
jgi:hypothetical protein